MAIDLMNYLPDYYGSNARMIELQGLLSAEINDLATAQGETIDEFFLDTATTLLSRHETIFGLSIDVTKTNEFRRERIKARIRGTGTTTKEMIVNAAAAYSRGEVEVIEDNANNKFVIKFTGTFGIPGNMADLTITLDEIKPAHLEYTYEYVYRTNDVLSAYTHTDLSVFTHHDIREGSLV